MDLRPLLDLLDRRRVAVLTGAGLSTESGIPDYRGPETARRARNPIRFADFVASGEGRQRYWARSYLGWPKMDSARPNDGHRALAAMEASGLVQGLITQNVDRLHDKAGHRDRVELHGALAEVICLGCGAISSRHDLQDRLAAMNPGFGATDIEFAPDGDAELEATSGFRVAGCPACGGHLKPHVVFFGEGVPRERVDRSYGLVEDADVLLVAGTSLTVFSGFRFVKRAAKAGVPVAIVNLGSTRGDELAQVCVAAKTGVVLPALAEALGAADGSQWRGGSASLGDVDADVRAAVG
jgi:NAD-dependent deacetylase sirtuin 4